MSEGIWIAIITGAFAVLGQWLISHNQNQKRKVEDAVRDAKMEDRLQRVENQLSIHNHYAERFAEIGTDIAVIKNDIKTLYKEKG